MGLKPVRNSKKVADQASISFVQTPLQLRYGAEVLDA